MRHQNDASPSSRLKPSEILTSSAMATVQVHSIANKTISRQPEKDVTSKCLAGAQSRQPQQQPPTTTQVSSTLRKEVDNIETNSILECDDMTTTTTTSIKSMLDSPTTPTDVLGQQTHQDDLEEAMHNIITDTKLTEVNENHRQSHRSTSIKLSDAQLDRLNTLIKIIRNGDYDEFLKLIERRQLKNLLNVFVDGQTALHYTLIYGRSLAWCKQLIINGANPNLTNRAGWHPIHLAAFNGSRETLRYLIDCIAN